MAQVITHEHTVIQIVSDRTDMVNNQAAGTCNKTREEARERERREGCDKCQFVDGTNRTIDDQPEDSDSSNKTYM